LSTIGTARRAKTASNGGIFAWRYRRLRAIMEIAKGREAIIFAVI
jgi:hypothetical protein